MYINCTLNLRIELNTDANTSAREWSETRQKARIDNNIL